MLKTLPPPAISGLSAIAGRYRFLLCDVWGVIHNGLHAHPEACEALLRFRESGGRIVLITNAPRPKAEVVAQLDWLHVPPAAYDDIVTSGDVARMVLAERPERKIYHLGPDRDLPLYEGLEIELVEEDAAQFISCTGLFDDRTETPDDYMERLRGWVDRGLVMLCVNPDRVVERGDRLLWCAGALAERYEQLGGEAIYCGKPYAPIYDEALGRLAAIAGAAIDRRDVLAIGDGMPTDLRGAADAGIDALFVTEGIHSIECRGDDDEPDAGAVHRFLESAGVGAIGFIPHLSW